MVVARSFSRTPTLSIPDFLESLIRWKKSEPIEDRSCVFDVIAPLEFNENRDPRIDQIIENEEELENYVNNNAYRINRRSLSNMCLNIAVPVAIVSIKLSSTASGTICNRLTKLTQPNPIAIDGVTVLTAALSSLMRNDDITVALKAATDSCKRPSILKHLTNCFKNAHPHGEDDLTREVHGENELPVDYLGIALQIAFYNLCHAKSFEEGIINAIEVGGDTATNASITGAVLGAKFGVSSIPEDWINTVVQAKLERHLTFPDVYFGDADNLVKLLILKGSL
uniref:ADP-ribosylglycohydrolase family protein n=1 Tax=Rhabditophanes sp. KR3021 TaxID=114890 RepID=A0AC35UCF2_9BILA